VAKNRAAVKALRASVAENYGERKMNISPDSIYTGALGAALFALARARRPPVEVNDMSNATHAPHCAASTSARAVKVRRARSAAARAPSCSRHATERLRGATREVVDSAPARALRPRRASRATDVDYVATTGEGEIVEFRTGHFYGMTTHARGALFLDPACAR
jgi:hypothetical protein